MLEKINKHQSLELNLEHAGAGLTCDGNPAEIRLFSRRGDGTVEHDRWQLSHESVVKLAWRFLSMEAVGDLVPHNALPANLSSEIKQSLAERRNAMSAFEKSYRNSFGIRRDELGVANLIDELDSGSSVGWGSVLTVSCGSDKSRGIVFHAAGPVSIQVLADALSAFLSDWRTLRDFPDYAISLRRWGEQAFEGNGLRSDIPATLEKGVKLPNQDGEIIGDDEEEFDPFKELAPDASPSAVSPSPQLPETHIQSVEQLPRADGALAPRAMPLVGNGSISDREEQLERHEVEAMLRDVQKKLKELERRTTAIDRRERKLTEREALLASDANLNQIRRERASNEATLQQIQSQSEAISEREKALAQTERELKNRIKHFSHQQATLKAWECTLKQQETELNNLKLSQIVAGQAQGHDDGSRAEKNVELVERERKIQQAESSNSTVALRLNALEATLTKRAQKLQEDKNALERERADLERDKAAFEEERSALEEEWRRQDEEQERLLAEAQAKLDEAKAIELEVAKLLRIKLINHDERT